MQSPLIKPLLAIFSFLLTTMAYADIYDDAVSSASRPQADLARDESFKPAQVLRFAGIEPGDTALDMFAGGGYFSELLSAVVGSSGMVYMHNNGAYLGFAGDDIAARLAGNRLPNVQRLDAELDAMDVPAQSVDIIVLSMAYHDVYYSADGWTVTPETFYPALKRLLKPGGTVLVLDHLGEVGTGSSLGNTLHRIDPEFTKADFAAHGFEFLAESQLLINPDDDLSLSVFDPLIQGKTSKFVFKFTTP
jgi:predicted methyltransferase